MARKKLKARADGKAKSHAASGHAPSTLRFSTRLLRPKAPGRSVAWSFLTLPKEARLPSRGMVSVEGTFGGHPFRATLEPDGQGGHWMRVDRKLREAAGVRVGDVVMLEIAPVAPSREPEPRVPTDLRKALAAAPARARQAWSDITPLARRDWVQWITSGKRAETRPLRVRNACDMLAKGKRRPCCFDRSGMYSNGLSCPEADTSS